MGYDLEYFFLIKWMNVKKVLENSIQSFLKMPFFGHLVHYLIIKYKKFLLRPANQIVNIFFIYIYTFK